MKYTTFLALIALFVLLSSLKLEKIQDSNLRTIRKMLSDSTAPGKSKLRFDGVYSTYDTTRCYIGAKRIGERAVDMYYVINFFAFYKNGISLHPVMSFSNAAEIGNYLGLYRPYSEEQNKRHSEWGAYTIHNDTIEILCYRQFSKNGMVTKPCLTHYSGILKGRDSIVEFKMLPPYPNVKAKMNNYFKDDIGPRTLVFKRIPEKRWIDSNAVWLNKYRENED